MRVAVRTGFLIALIASAIVGGRMEGSVARTDASSHKQSAPPKETAGIENEYTAGLVTGPPHSTEFAIAQEIATTLATGQETGPHGEMALRVIPMVGNGGMRNLTDVLTLPDADLAIAPVILANRLQQRKTLGDVRNKLVYIAPLFNEEFHLVAPPEIKSPADLAGKTISLGEAGSVGDMLGREVLDALGVKAHEVNLGLDAALDAMRKGRISAALLVSAKPVDFLTRDAQFDAIHFVPIPYSQLLHRGYVAATLRHEDYPTIIGVNESVDTIAVKSALFAYNWPAGSKRFRLLKSFVQTFFSRFSEFQSGAHSPQWREVNLAATLAEWQRFRPAERWLQRQELRSKFDRFIKRSPAAGPADRDALFRDFLRWRERKDKAK